MMIDKLKILYLSGSGGEDNIKNLLEEVSREKGYKLSMLSVPSAEELQNQLQDFSPHAVLVENFSAGKFPAHQLESIKKFSPAATVVLLIDGNGEDSALKLTGQEIDDYIFRDRPSRLLPIFRRLVQNLKTKESDPDLELRESEEKYRSFFMNSMDGILMTVTDGQILAANPAACRMFQMTEEEICTVGRFGIVDPEDIRVKEAIKKRQINGHVKAEVTFKRKDGSTFPGEITSSVFSGVGGEKRTSMILRDLSEKKKIEQEKEAVLQRLRREDEKLLTAQRIAKLGYWEQDLENQSLYWTEEVFRIWGRNKANFCPDMKSILPTIHPEDVKKFVRENSMAMAGLRNLDFEHRILLPDGTIKWVHERGALSLTEAGERIFEGTVQDITDRKSFNEKLVLSEARNRGILKSQTNYLIRIDLEGNYSYCNDKFLNDFGWIFPNETLVGQLAIASVQEHHHDRVKQIHKECLAKPNQTLQVEIDKLTRNGESKTTLWDFICLTDVQGQPMEIQAVGIDITDRVVAEKALWDSNQRYELVSKASSDAIYDWDIADGEVKWNETYSELFGYPKEDLTISIEEWSNLLHPEDTQVVESLGQALAGQADNWQAEYRYKKGDNTYAYVNERGAIIRDSEGKAIRMVGAVQDITKRKLALQKLMLSEARHRGLIQSQTNYVIRTDFHGNYTYCNDKFVEEFGWVYENKEILGQNAIVSIKEYHHQRIEETVELCVQHPGKVFQVELDKPGKNGKTKTTLWDMVFLQSSVIEESEIQCIGIDISDRVEAERQMKFQADLLDKIGQAVIARDMEGKVKYWNKSASNIYGWEREEALGQDIAKLIPSSRTAQEEEQMLQTLQEGTPKSAEYIVTGKSGNQFPALVTDSPFFDYKGVLQGVVSISSDISERKRSEVELQNYTMELIAANKGLEQFSFIVSHNLRAPLANLLGITDLLGDDDFPPETRERLMKELFNNIKRLDGVVNDLNAILRVRTEMNENREKIDFEALVNSIKMSIDHLVQKEKVQIVTDFSACEDFTTVKSYLHSIFYNLISNSIKYRQAGKDPVIRISSAVEGDQLKLIFEDNGLGMDLSRRADQVFGLYKRFHHHVEGKGMGLFMVKTQVESLGGTISVESEQNKGSRFILEFNISSVEEDERAEAIHADR
ncbi:MAG: PAS domain S-box protein [Salinimicrobium sp.]